MSKVKMSMDEYEQRLGEAFVRGGLFAATVQATLARAKVAGVDMDTVIVRLMERARDPYFDNDAKVTLVELVAVGFLSDLESLSK